MSIGGFPGMNTAPGGFPGAPQQQAAQPNAVQFVIQAPTDATWQPFESTDVLEFDGYYCARITGEKPRMIRDKVQLILTLTLQDPDVAGKTLNKFLPNPTQSTKDTWFLWRGLVRSITGSIEAAQSAFSYQPGMYANQLVFFKSEPYLESDGTQRTGVANFVTKTEWEEAAKAGGTHYRWQPKQVSRGANGSAVGALPGGTPMGFPGLGAGIPGLPGAPSSPGASAPVAQAPQPAAAPMQQFAPAPVAPPPVAAPAPVSWPAPPAAVAPPPVAATPQWMPAAQPGGMQFGSPQPQQPAAAAPATPQPGAFSPFPGFVPPTAT